MTPDPILTYLRCLLNKSLTHTMSAQSLGNTVKPCPYLNTYINTYIIYKQHFWLTDWRQSGSPSCVAAFWFMETIFQKATNRVSIPQHPNPSIPQTPSVFCQLGVPRILFPTVFPAESPALNGSYSQYGLVMGVSR